MIWHKNLPPWELSKELDDYTLTLEPIALRKAKNVCIFGLSECSRVNMLSYLCCGPRQLPYTKVAVYCKIASSISLQYFYTL